MNLQQLRVFVLTVKLQSLSVVAEVLKIKQPTVTFHLNQLQKYWNVPLFVTPSYHVIKLTAAGEALFRQAQRVTAIVDEIEQIMEDYQQLRQGIVSIGSTHTPATYILPPHLAAYKQAYPLINIHLEVKTAPVILEKVKNYELDFGIVSFDWIEDEELVIKPLLQDDLVLVLPTDHSLASKSEITALDLCGIPFVSHERHSVSRRLIDQWAWDNHIELDIAMEVSSTETMKEVIKSGIGAGILSERSIQKEVRLQEVITFPLPSANFHRYIFVIHRKNKQFTQPMANFYKELLLI